MNKITFVLPTVRKDALLAETCILSIFKLFNNNDIEKFYIITRFEDIDFFKDFFKEYKKFIDIIDENLLYKNSYSNDGWHIQQVLKLYISKYINTEYYIVLDSDCYLTKKINYLNLFYNNKPILSLTNKHTNDWLIKSCKYYNIDYNELPEIIMNVTPQLLKTTISIELCNNVNVAELINNGCNEFWLYFCYIYKYYKFDDIYYIDYNNQLSNNHIWVKEFIKNDSIEYTICEQFKDKSTLFTLFQSNMYINPDLYLFIIKKNILAL